MQKEVIQKLVIWRGFFKNQLLAANQEFWRRKDVSRHGQDPGKGRNAAEVFRFRLYHLCINARYFLDVDSL